MHVFPKFDIIKFKFSKLVFKVSLLIREIITLLFIITGVSYNGDDVILKLDCHVELKAFRNRWLSPHERAVLDINKPLELLPLVLFL